jgi:hypothetical protein
LAIHEVLDHQRLGTGRRLRAEGMSVQQAEYEAVAAAVAVLMVANALRVNTDWFWDGPSA